MGDNAIVVTVTAEDTNAVTRTYTVTVTRAAAATPEVTIAAGASAIYNESGASFTVTRTGATTAPLAVTVALTQTKQFLEATALSRTVTIGAGSSSETLSISSSDLLLPDSETRESGTLTAMVQAGTGYTPGTADTATVDVTVALTVSFDELSYSVDEGVGTLQVTLVARTGVGTPVPGATSLSVSTRQLDPPEAVSPQDYEAVAAIVQIPAAAYVADGNVYRAEVAVDVVILDDARDEPDERLHLALETTPGLLGKNSNFTDADGVGCRNPNCGMPITIEDDDTAGVTVSESALTVTEEDMTGDSYTVVLNTHTPCPVIGISAST